ncbi:MAG: hypothetical protein QXJ02_01335 [Candidatus Bathyarchaeia archaeon]
MTAEKFTARDTALTAVFTALYVIFGFLKISPIIGLQGHAITFAAIIAPLIGILLGPLAGSFSTFFGGVVGSYFGAFSLPSLASGVATSLCSGLLYRRKRIIAFLLYTLLFLILAFYPIIGPVWLFPIYTWFQIIGLIILISPFQGWAERNFSHSNPSRLAYALFVTSLVSTLAGQMAGTIVFEAFSMSQETYLATWMATAFLYPVERTIIALGSTVIGMALFKLFVSHVGPFSGSSMYEGRSQTSIR